MPKLVIVESPTKAKTLKSLLSKEYIVKASNGHVRDLPKSGLGVDVEHNYEPEYIIPDKAKKVIDGLKKDAKDSDLIILATDPDREGEAIAWHLKVLLEPKKKTKKGTKHIEFGRVVFHELTKEAIEDAFKDPGVVNDSLVDAQQARRVLDRLVGYKLSPLLWKKVRYGLSAGRVQSVAVRLIVEKERERKAFDPEEYWVIKGHFNDDAEKREFKAELFEFEDNKLKVTSKKEADKVKNDLEEDSFGISNIKKSERNKKPYAPFKTSTLQQSMANVFSFSARRTMSAAQKLFEKGFITYHRTDSINLSKQFVKAARSYISKEFDKKLLPEKPNEYVNKSASAQEAHEAIRPTDPKRTPKEDLQLTDDEYKVYTLIWKRSLESQMLPAVYDQTTISVTSEKKYLFRATGSVMKFDGWMFVSKYRDLFDEENGSSSLLPEYNQDEKVLMKSLDQDQKFTQPPARYSDASLIKKLEELGIGRPSTYAPTISTIEARGYVEKENRYFIPKDVAYVVTDLLVEHFPEVVGYEFTAQLEEKLDHIASGDKKWEPVIREFFEPFEKVLEVKEEQLHKTDITTLEETDEECPDCGKKVVIKLGKYGKFLSCSGYPDCKYAKPILEENGNGEGVKEDYGKCEECEDGIYILKQSRFGKFLACSNYPKCKSTKQFLEKIGMQCPECGEGDVIIKKAKRKSFYGCSRYPDCEWSSWTNPMIKKDE
jgi:DNA topoisomerase-1